VVTVKDWTNWQDIGFGLLVVLAFLWASLQAWRYWLTNRKAKERPEDKSPPAVQLDTQVILQIISEYSERYKESTQVLTSLTAAITELNATQRELGTSFTKLNDCVDKVQDKLEDVIQTVDKQNAALNEFKTQLAVIQAGMKS
jgi:peptidoglycan hydrolase CwlO-like protein